MSPRAKALPAPDQPTLPGLFDEPSEALEPAAEAPEIGGRPLSAEQEPAVARRSESLLLSAAAGSGKTSVLVERFVRAVCEDGIAPSRILAITFTERAAGELRARIRARLLELGERQAAQDAESAFLGTFHGFCARLLRAHPLAGELDVGFAVLDEGLAGQLREQAFGEAVAELLAGERPQAVDLAAAFGIDGLRAMVLGVFLELRSRGQSSPRLPLSCDGFEAGTLDVRAARSIVLLDELLTRFASAYERLKRQRGAADFDDLELHAAALLGGDDGIRRVYAERFELLMIDEFQDTNRRELAILEALEHENLFTVGDELQSIYGFRHAEVSLFRDRRDELESRGASLALTLNFRSRAAVLEVVNAAFCGRFERFAPLVARREDGDGEEGAVELLLTHSEGWDEDEQLGRRVAAGLPDAPRWRQAEARLLAERVAQLVSDGEAKAGEVVVLLRSTPDLELYERALQLSGLQTLATVGTFWDRQQIGDLIAYLQALANPLDEEALYSVLASPLAGCSRDGLAWIGRSARRREGGPGSAWQALLELEGDEDAGEGLTRADRDALIAFAALLARERACVEQRSIASLIERGLGATGYRSRVLALQWGERRVANIEKLLRVARGFEEREGRDLRAFLDYVAHLRRAGVVEPEAPLDGVEREAVRLMSIHAAKGLEFPVVCVADLGRKPNLRQPALLVDGDRVGLRLATLDGAAAEPALDHTALAEERAAREAQEEDRILYVAMTRARERLLLSGACNLESWPAQARGQAPMVWLTPALAGDLIRDAAAGTDAVAPAGVVSVGAARMSYLVSTPARARDLLRLPSGEEPQLAVAAVPQERTAALAVIAEADAGAMEGPRREQPGTFSYTSLHELERCGFRFYLERVLGLPEDREAARGEGNAKARERGTVVHALMEHLDFASPRAPSPGQVRALAAELGVAVTEAEALEMTGLLEPALASPFLARLAAAVDVRREHPFAFSSGEGEPLLVGFIDLLARESDGTWLVLDYKTDRLGEDVSLEALAARDYAVQRLVYALAVLRSGAERVEVLHWFLERPLEWASATYVHDDLAQLEGRLTELAGREYVVSPTPHRGLCLTCPGRRGLCSWGEEQTLRELAIGA
jgi:ATP-dependent exoDNAse (exonuclease V) beta subunit